MAIENGENKRRHDLDAVRSFAMLLGIYLHAALAYIGGMWIVSDSPESSMLALSVSTIHGFRMPLFFLLSGFFTAMLWRRRGLGSLLWHRTRRVAIPLALSCVTIVPVMSHVAGWAISQQGEEVVVRMDDGAEREPAPTEDIWTAAAFGDMERLRVFGSDSEQLDMPDPNFGVTPLGWATLKDYPDAVAYLLEIGADPSARYQDRNTPMHTACFFGRYEIAQLLVGAGADLTILNATGEMPINSLAHNEQTTTFIANMIQVPIDFASVSEKREEIRALLDSETITAKAQPISTNALHDALHGNFFHHLWFLWYLCLFVVGFAVVACVLRVISGFSIPRRLVSLPLCLVWVVPVTMVPQWFMHAQGAGFGPDTSTGIIPALHVLSYYAVFFGFGALVFVVRGTQFRFGPPRSWTYLIPIASPFLFFGLTLEFSEGAAAFLENEFLRRILSDAMQVTYAWLMTFGFIAMFESLLHRERRWVRYLSDSSYWLYLVHLPIVIAGQAYLLRSDLGPVAKTSVLTIVVTLGLLVIYQFGVRYTPIGTMLNGKRARAERVQEGSAQDVA